MKSLSLSGMPIAVRRAFVKLGRDIDVARRKRALSIAMICERAGISPTLYRRIRQGSPSVAFGSYALVLVGLGVANRIGTLLDPSIDDAGLMLDTEPLPKRIRRPHRDAGAL
jgi:hypothetical protein